jgi:hypothetical protein
MSYQTTKKDLYFLEKFGADNVGRRGINSPSIPKKDHHKFAQLLNSMVETCGSIDTMCKTIGISSGTYWEFITNERLTARTAKQILAGYHAMRANKT